MEFLTCIFLLRSNHLDQAKTAKPMDIFHPRWQRHYQQIWENWQRNVTDKDTVLLAGDTSWAMKLEETVWDFDFLHQLPGQKILIRGNHDYWWQSLQKINEFLPDDFSLLQNSCLAVEGKAVCGTRGWITPGCKGFGEEDGKIFQRELLRLEMALAQGKKTGLPLMVMLHYPPCNEKNEKSAFVELMADYGVEQCFYGHLHEVKAEKELLTNQWGIGFTLLSCDYIGFAPMLLWEE